jgi:hypothetical protein
VIASYAEVYDSVGFAIGTVNYSMILCNGWVQYRFQTSAGVSGNPLFFCTGIGPVYVDLYAPTGYRFFILNPTGTGVGITVQSGVTTKAGAVVSNHVDENRTRLTCYKFLDDPNFPVAGSGFQITLPMLSYTLKNGV